jgi:hypothetical protein
MVYSGVLLCGTWLYLLFEVKGPQVRMYNPALTVLSVDFIVYFNDFEAPNAVGSVYCSARWIGSVV